MLDEDVGSVGIVCLEVLDSPSSAAALLSKGLVVGISGAPLVGSF